jgi:hypothetical protein
MFPIRDGEIDFETGIRRQGLLSLTQSLESGNLRSLGALVQQKTVNEGVFDTNQRFCSPGLGMLVVIYPGKSLEFDTDSDMKVRL